MLDQRKLETLFRIGCHDNLIIELLKTGTFTPTGDTLIDDNLESLIDHKIFNNNNWGGKREGAGRPKNNQVENQVENQDKNQDTDIDIYNNNNNNNIYSRDSNKGGVGEKEKGKSVRGAFIPPPLEEVLEYAKERCDLPEIMGGFQCSKEMVIEFYNHYDRQGWILGNGIHMTNWKSALKKWCSENIKKLEIRRN